VRRVFQQGFALAGVTLLLAGGCSDDDATTTAAGTPSSSSPAVTTTVTRPATTSATSALPPPTTAPAGPAVAEAGGWRMVITAPTALATIGPAVDLCYEVTGPTREAEIGFEVGLILTATASPQASVRVDASVGRGSVRVNLGSPQTRRYDMPVQAFVNGQRVEGLAVVIRGVDFGVAPPTGCA
jgi:hypothetical protein